MRTPAFSPYWLFVWAFLLVLYVALISTTTPVELAVGAAMTAAATAVAKVAVGAFDVDVAVPRFRWRWLLAFPVDAGRDVLRLAQRVMGRGPSRRQHDGWWDELEIPGGRGRADAARAYAVLVVSLTPASFVSDVHTQDASRGDDDAPGSLRVHRWAPAGPVERAIAP
jgi:hypothetical protein